jgi:hypothetical protein
MRKFRGISPLDEQKRIFFKLIGGEKPRTAHFNVGSLLPVNLPDRFKNLKSKKPNP